MLLFSLVFPDSSKVPLVDLGFAISASSQNSDETFRKTKNTVKYIVDKYGKAKITYGLVVFGDEAVTKISFSESFATSADLKRMVDIITKPTGTPNLKNALVESKMLFESGVRSNAKKVLIVIVDSASDSSPEEVKNATKPLTENDVSIIVVAIGKEATPNQLKDVTPDLQDFVQAKNDTTAKELGDRVMKQVLKGNLS